MIKYYIRNVMKTYFYKKGKDEPLTLKCNGPDSITDDIKIANEFNRFFADIGVNLASNMKHFDNHKLSYKT